MKVLLGWFTILALVLAIDIQAQVQLGSEVLAANGFKELLGKRVGLITNPSGVNRSGQSTIDLLHSAPGVRLVSLFGPEHGVYGDVKAGENIHNKTDKRTGLPVHSLYGGTRKPTPAMLQGLDALVYDLQDTGVRSYTFISTMGLAMEACAVAGVEFIVLDRPNPLGGERAEGPMVEDRFRSFVGQWDIPYAYGLTCGELARMINGEGWIRKPCKLTVIPMKGWRRSMVWQNTGLRWVPTSPNVPRAESPLYYAATGLFGEIAGGSGANIGTRIKRPFECVIAPWLDARKFSAAMNSYGLRGVSFPTFSVTHEGKKLQGVLLKFTDAAHAPLVALNFHLLEGLRQASGRDLFREAVKAKKDFQMLDRVSGSDATRKALLTGRSAADIVNSWKPGEEAFQRERQEYLFYTDELPTPPKVVAQAKPAPGPVAASVPSASALPLGAPQASPEMMIVTVSKGDTAEKIAKDLGIAASDITLANRGVDLNRLKAGQKLRIPRPSAR
ncbi:MAG TPA: exo-beta-N-acetylmuramidase NamZ domain-containing protein [Verrucomicrobiae bacterium]|nr:exo-beta-N-acetylmuramidase NamZ domain-containing protein [Verrucomicrobiae bacterium]